MRDTGHRNRALLFLAAVLLPSAVLVGTTLRLIGQERELSVRRWEEDRAVLALRLGQGLLSQLRTIQEDDPAVLARASLRDGNLRFPWDLPNTQGMEAPGAGEAYRQGIQRATALEFQDRDFQGAARIYGRTASTTQSPVLRAEAQLHQGRALLQTDRCEEARAVYLELAELSPGLLDRDGMPLPLYGVEGLLRSGATVEEAASLLERLRLDVALYTRPVLYALVDVAESVRLQRSVSGARGGGLAALEPALEIVDDVQKTAMERLRILEAMEDLRRDFPILRATVGEEEEEDPYAEGGGVWIPWGPEPWLVGLGQGPAGDDANVVVVQPNLLLARAAGFEPDIVEVARRATLLGSGDQGGEALGSQLRGLRASIPPDLPPGPEGSSVEGWFFRLLLPLILVLTGFAAYLTWRDVQRETEAIQLRTQFVSSVTHELKTPLTSIRMFAETLRMGRNAGPKAREEYLETIVHETERLSRLINNVLDFARIDRGEKSYHFSRTNLGRVAYEAAQAVSYPLAQDGFALEVDVANDLPEINADSDALIQALLNLLTNAMKFSGTAREIRLRVRPEGPDVLLQVADQGPGIPPEDHEAIFLDFYRTAEAEAQGIPGTGLGLSIVTHIARAHGGHVDVSSRPGEGSTFTLRIPQTLPGREGKEEGIGRTEAEGIGLPKGDGIGRTEEDDIGHPEPETSTFEKDGP